jgi:hypothetical protein
MGYSSSQPQVGTLQSAYKALVPLKNTSVDGRIILKRILKKEDVVVWIGFI